MSQLKQVKSRLHLQHCGNCSTRGDQTRAENPRRLSSSQATTSIVNLMKNQEFSKLTWCDFPKRVLHSGAGHSSSSLPEYSPHSCRRTELTNEQLSVYHGAPVPISAAFRLRYVDGLMQEGGLHRGHVAISTRRGVRPVEWSLGRMGIRGKHPAFGAAQAFAAAGLCLFLTNCSSSSLVSHVDPKYGVSSSPRVVALGDPVPKGGGTYRVGKPYTVAGRLYVPEEDVHYREEGLASW